MSNTPLNQYLYDLVLSTKPMKPETVVKLRKGIELWITEKPKPDLNVCLGLNGKAIATILRNNYLAEALREIKDTKDKFHILSEKIESFEEFLWPELQKNNTPPAEWAKINDWTPLKRHLFSAFRYKNYIGVPKSERQLKRILDNRGTSDA